MKKSEIQLLGVIVQPYGLQQQRQVDLHFHSTARSRCITTLVSLYLAQGYFNTQLGEPATFRLLDNPLYLLSYSYHDIYCIYIINLGFIGEFSVFFPSWQEALNTCKSWELFWHERLISNLLTLSCLRRFLYKFE